MPYRILKYELNIIESVLTDISYVNKKYEYPLVIPIVLYTGKEKWNAALNLRNIQYKWKNYNEQELSKYNILDINEISDNELLKENSIISKIMYTKKEKEFLEKSTKVLALNLVGEKKAKKFLKKLKIGDDIVMLAVIDMINEEKRLRKIELEKQWANGKAEGRTQAKIDYVKNMLKEKLPIELISKITGMTEKEIKKYVDNIKK